MDWTEREEMRAEWFDDSVRERYAAELKDLDAYNAAEDAYWAEVEAERRAALTPEERAREDAEAAAFIAQYQAGNRPCVPSNPDDIPF